MFPDLQAHIARATRVLAILGTRPEAIKLAPVIRKLQADPRFEVGVCSTGQHEEMLTLTLAALGISPRCQLALPRDRQSISALTGTAVDEISKVIGRERPAAVLVQGDTTTCLSGALAASYERVKVAHVEAGLRSGRRDDPFPEEINRRLVGQLAHWHFAPTERAAENLVREGVDRTSIHVTGNTVVDSLHWALERKSGQVRFRSALRHILVTLHRRDNHGPKLQKLAAAILQLASRGDVEILLPLHVNPAVRNVLGPALAGAPNVTLTEHLDYFDFIASLAACDIVLTDSGGVQEEAPSLGKPILVLRETTERPEAIEVGAARLVGTEPHTICAAASQLLDDKAAYTVMTHARNPFGDGRAADRVIEVLAAALISSSTAYQLR